MKGDYNMRKPIIAGNWKMNKTLDEANSFIDAVKDNVPSNDVVDAVVGAPNIYTVKLVEWTEGTDLKVAAQNAYFEDEYNGQAQPPACSSMDGKLGIGCPGGACANCPLNKYGSADDGKGKKCKNLRRIYILRSGEILPLLVTLPPTSIRNFSDYISKRIVTKGMKACDVVTKMTLTVEKSSSGIKYSKVQFAIARTLSPEEKNVMRAFSDNIKQTTRLQRIDETDNEIIDE